MKVLITGSSGLVGSALVSSLTADGHSVTRLVRSQDRANAGKVYWNPDRGELDVAGLEGIEAVVNLAGETIAEKWTRPKKTRIMQSRLRSTRLLSDRLGSLKQPPRVMVSASAIGYYGDRGDRILLEESPGGSGFLPEVCHQWEAAAGLAAQWGARVVCLRIGIVLSRAGGALRKMLLPFRMGVGGKLGSGRQYMSWIAIDDLAGAISHCLMTQTLNGPVNAVAPNPVTNLEFTKALGKVLFRPTLFPVPRFVVSLAFGEMGRELLLASTRVEPARLKSSGYVFRYPEIEGALRHVLGKEKKHSVASLGINEAGGP